MKNEDIGSIAILLTWIFPLAYYIYYQLQGIGGYELIRNMGKNPYLFIIDLVLFYIGITLIVKNVNKDKVRVFLNYLYSIPIINILVAAIYSYSALGFSDGLKIFTDGMLISMYNFLILATLLLIDLNIRMDLTRFLTEEKNIFIVIAEFIIFAILRYFYGPSFIMMIAFIFIIPISIYILNR